MHHDKRNEAPGVEARSHCRSQIIQQSIFHAGCLSTAVYTCSLRPSGPRSNCLLRQRAVIDHGGRDAILPPQTGIADDSGADVIVALRQQMITECFVYEVFFCLSSNRDD